MWKDKPGTIGSNDVRLESNLKIVKLLEQYFKQHPHMRFHQGMRHLFGEQNNFNQESATTLKLLQDKEAIKNLIQKGD